jgi:hypothetical protein
MKIERLNFNTLSRNKSKKEKEKWKTSHGIHAFSNEVQFVFLRCLPTCFFSQTIFLVILVDGEY